MKLLEQRVLLNQAELDAYEAECLAAGYEGVMVRDPQGKYKFGRSTARSGELVKIKRFTDAEALCVGYEERMHNDNVKGLDELGYAKRSSHKANQRPAGDLGALVVRGPNYDPCFSIGTGFTAEQRVALWAERESLPGRIVKYKSFEVTGVKDAPRFPVFLGFRSELDL